MGSWKATACGARGPNACGSPSASLQQPTTYRLHSFPRYHTIRGIKSERQGLPRVRGLWRRISALTFSGTGRPFPPNPAFPTLQTVSGRAKLRVRPRFRAQVGAVRRIRARGPRRGRCRAGRLPRHRSRLRHFRLREDPHNVRTRNDLARLGELRVRVCCASRDGAPAVTRDPCAPQAGPPAQEHVRRARVATRGHRAAGPARAV